jgi:anti-sigma regulatory factor (Ser/Thr protein kinase)
VQGSSQHTWSSRPEHVAAARRAALQAARRAGADRATLDAIRIAVTEAVSNVVVHGYDGSPDGSFTVAVEARDHELLVSVRDMGVGMRPHPDGAGAGLGLPIIARVAASFTVLTPPGGGTEVRMTFPLHQPARV